MVTELTFAAIIVAVVAAVSAFIANKLRPDKTVQELTSRVLSWLVLGTLALMTAGCVFILQTGCLPDDQVCDMPAMAAAGVTYIGAMIVVALVVIGTPVTYVVLKFLRRP